MPEKIQSDSENDEIPRMERRRCPIPEDSSFPKYEIQLKGIEEDRLDSSYIVDEYEKTGESKQ